MTSTEVIAAYNTDSCSLRSGRFLEKLLYKRIAHNGKEVTPDQVLMEFNRLPDRNNKTALAIARLKTECCQRGQLLSGQKVTPDAVVKAFPNSPLGKLGIAHFKAECCLKRLILGGRQVTPDAVVAAFPDCPKGKLGIARFKAECCLREWLLRGQKVPPDEVARAYQLAKAPLELARFLADCCLMDLPLTPDGKQKPEPVPPETVVKAHPDTPEGKLSIARFQEECCLREILLHGQQVTPAAVVKAFPDTPSGKLGKARFLAECCLRERLLTPDGKHIPEPVSPDTVVRAFPDNPEGKLGIARFKEECCLRGLLLSGQKVTPDAVAKAFPNNPEGKLGLARFQANCCLRDLLLTPDGKSKPEPVSPETVVKAFPNNSEGMLGIAHFKAEYCLKEQQFKGWQATPEEAIQAFRLAKAPLDLARFMADCCLKGLLLTANGQQLPAPVSPDAVVNAYSAVKALLEIAHFKADCCLSGLWLTPDGKQVPGPVSPDAVVNAFRAANAPLGLAHFMAKCCLKGLRLNGRQPTPDQVVRAFQQASAPMGLAHFMADCCLEGLGLTPNGMQAPEPLKPGAVIKAFPKSPQGQLGRARFLASCCLQGLRLNGQEVTPDAVMKAYPDNPKGKLGIAHFLIDCCLRGWLLSGQRVIPNEVVNAFPDSPQGKLSITRFKEACCLRGLPLNGQFVTPDKVVHDFEQGGWLLEKAICYSLLALNAKKLKGRYLNNQQVLEAFRQVPGDHSSRQADYLIKRLHTFIRYDESEEMLATFQQARTVLNKAPVKDDGNRRQLCILHFVALQYDLPVDQRQSAEQIFRAINDLRSSFRNTRLLFFFMAYCFHTNQLLNGQTVEKNQVLNCLERLLVGSKMRRALGCWFEEFAARSSTNVVSNLLFSKREQPMVLRRDDHCPEKYHPLTRQVVRGDSPDPVPTVSHSINPPAKRVEVYVTRDHHGHYFPWQIVEHPNDEMQRSESTPGDATRSKADATGALKQLLNINAPPPPNKQSAPLSPLMLQTLEMIQGINSTYGKPAILITGSFSRYLQGLCPSFNDIDLICTGEEAAEILMGRLQAINTEMDTEIPKKVFIKAIPGCSAIRLPEMYNINLTEGDPGIKTVGLQATIDPGVAPKNSGVAPIHLPGIESPVICLPFHAETQLLIGALGFLADQLDPLTERLQKEPDFCIPRTILFNYPNSSEERIYGLFMRCLLTLNKARQFQTLLSEGKAGYQSGPDSTTLYYTIKIRLQELSAKLQAKLQSHTYHDHFVRSLENWIHHYKPDNDYLKKKCELIKGLLEILTAS